MRRIHPGWCVLLLTSCAPAPDEAAVRDVVVRYYDHLSERSWRALRGDFWPASTLSTIWQSEGDSAPRVAVMTIDEFVAAAPEGPGSRQVFEERPLKMDVRVGNGVASAWVRYAARFGDPGDMTCWTGTDVITLLRHEGAWRIVALAYANDGDGGPTGPDRCD